MSYEFTNGVDGWTLEAYDWDIETGRARFTYERKVSEEPRAGRRHGELMEDGTKFERRSIVRQQPYAPNHGGWR